MLDTHTAVASTVYRKYKEDTNDSTKTIIASTASPFKFTRSVMNALTANALTATKYNEMGDFELVDELSKMAKIAVPKAIEEIRTAPVLHQTVCEKEEMKTVVMKFLGIA